MAKDKPKEGPEAGPAPAELSAGELRDIIEASLAVLKGGGPKPKQVDKAELILTDSLVMLHAKVAPKMPAAAA